MAKVSLRIAYLIIIAGLFIIASFIAFLYQTVSLDNNFYIIIALLVVYIFLFGFAAGKNFATPVKQLLERAEGLREGDLKSKFELKSQDELEELGRELNKIAEEFYKKVNENEASKRSESIKAKTRILILEEVVDALDKKIKSRSLEFQRVAEEADMLKEQLRAKDAEIASLRKKLNK